jgi:hypothetical protein
MSNTRTSPIFPSEMWMKLGMYPRKSSSVCIFTAAFVERNDDCRGDIGLRLRTLVKHVETPASDALSLD